MITGSNTNVRHGGKLFHVQTEDSGLRNPHVIRHLYFGGTILASEKTKYNEMLDFDQLCKESLGKHWGTRSKAEQKDFSATLKALIEKNFLNRLKDSKDRKIEYESEEVLGVEASVVTRVSSGDPRAEKTEIEYQLQKTAKSWRVTDMVTDGVSLVSNYRSEFSKIITKDGYPRLLEKMQNKLAELRGGDKAGAPGQGGEL